MPLTCPHCQIVQADDNETCINCGRPLVPAAPDASLVDPALSTEADTGKSATGGDSRAAPDPVHSVQARRVSWRLPAAVVACLLLALAASALFAALRGPARRPALPAPTAAAPPVPEASPVSAPPPTPAATATAPKMPVTTAAKTPAVPLTITLNSTREGRHVKVGEDVTLIALAHGRSATLTLFYRIGGGKKTMLSFVEGSLCSTTWTPAVPGRYEFTATALDDRQQAAASRRIEITVDAPAPPPIARAAPSQEGPRRGGPQVAAAPSQERPARRPPPKTASQDGDRAPALTSHSALTNHSALTYHVAAAKFPFLRNATVLSDALNRRGYRAVPEPMADTHGKAVYVVVTGTYRSPKEARAAALALQRSGYPAYFFGSR